MSKRFVATFSLACIFFSSCLPKGDIFPFVDDFKEEVPKVATDKCLAENPDADLHSCNIKNCLVSPITLLAMHELLINVANALDKIGLPYWVDSGSAIAAERFNAHLPWDDDVDLGVFASDINDKILDKLTKELRIIGFELKPFISSGVVQNIVGYQGHYQISYKKPRFAQLVTSYKPGIAPEDIENLWLKYEAMNSLLPHLDILLFKEVSPGQFTYSANFFAGSGQLKGKTFAKKVLSGDKRVNILGQEFRGVQDFAKYGETAYNASDLLTNFYVSQEHSRGCKVMKFKDIRQHPKMLDYLLRYLDFVYSQPAAKAMGAKFDIEEVRKKYQN